MKDDKSNKPATEQAEEFDSDLQTWYKLQAQENPSDELDDAIIKMATEASALNNGVSADDSSQHKATLDSDKRTDNVVRVENSFWRQNRWALSSAASVMLVVTVIMLNPQSPQDILSDDAMPMMMQMSEPQDEQLESMHADVVKGASFEAKSTGVRRESLQADVTEAANFEANNPKTNSANIKSELRQAPRAPSAISASEQQFGGAAEPKMKQMGEAYGSDDRAKLGAEAPSNQTLPSQASSKDALSSHDLPTKSMPQREAVVSAKQALNHLQNLINSKQWGEADKLAKKIAKQYPNLKESEHPQYKR